MSSTVPYGEPTDRLLSLPGFCGDAYPKKETLRRDSAAGRGSIAACSHPTTKTFRILLGVAVCPSGETVAVVDSFEDHVD